MFSVLLGKYVRVEWESRYSLKVGAFWFYKKLPIVFPFLPAMCYDSGCSTSLSAFAVVSLFNFSHGGGCVVVFCCGLILHFPDDKQYQAFFFFLHWLIVHLWGVRLFKKDIFFRSLGLSSRPRHCFFVLGVRLEVYFSKEVCRKALQGHRMLLRFVIALSSYCSLIQFSGLTHA